jgi:hypothetical protein
MELRFTEHAEQMLVERQIEKSWVERTVLQFQRRDEPGDGMTHYLRAIPERDGRILRVIVDPLAELPTVITAFFDRRLEEPLL